MRDAIALAGFLANANVAAFLRVIRVGETCQDDQAYRWLFGSTVGNPKLFSSFVDHPRVRTFETYDGQFIKNGKIDYTTAAGAYQIVESTWDPVAKRLGLTDFTPRNQDIAALALIEGRGALEDVVAGRFEQAVSKCRKEWASLPGSTYGQPTVALGKAKAAYVQWGGSFAPLAIQQEAQVGPFIIPAITAIASAVPELVKIFGPNASETAQRNMKAAEAVIEVAKEALGAKNEQDVVEQIQADPAAAVTVRKAIQENWFAISEVGGGIAAAREANLKVQGDKNFLHNPAIWVSALLLLFPLMLNVDFLFVHPDAYDGNLRTQIVTAQLAVIMMVGAYWLGTTSESAAAKRDK